MLDIAMMPLMLMGRRQQNDAAALGLQQPHRRLFRGIDRPAPIIADTYFRPRAFDAAAVRFEKHHGLLLTMPATMTALERH